MKSMKEKLNRLVVGRIQIFRVSDGKWILIDEKKNLVTYGGSDILAKALANELKVNCIYVVFENNPAAIRISTDASNIAATYATSSPNRSFVRVPTMGDPVYSSTDPDYANNEVSFLGVTDGSSEFPAVPVTDGVSVFYHSALVAAPDMDDQTKDVVFSCANFSSDQTKVAGAQIGIRWTLTFTSP